MQHVPRIFGQVLSKILHDFSIHVHRGNRALFYCCLNSNSFLTWSKSLIKTWGATIVIFYFKRCSKAERLQLNEIKTERQELSKYAHGKWKQEVINDIPYSIRYLVHALFLIFSVRIYCLNILRVKFAKFKENFKKKLEAENLQRTQFRVWKSVNTVQFMFLT